MANFFTDWTSIATHSVEFDGFPFVDIISVSDSLRSELSTGRIYFYLVNVSYTARDVAVDSRVSFVFSEEQNLTCSTAGTDAMEPTCARVTLMGNVRKLDSTTPEYEIGYKTMLSRHPAVEHWLKNKCKLPFLKTMMHRHCFVYLYS